MINSVVVLGGGSAGWLSACLIAARHVSVDSNFKVTLIESPEIPTIGVGEGTWPTMVNTLKQLGISEYEFIQQCDASFKQGSKFVGWKGAPFEDSYYHPFSPPQSFDTASLVQIWQEELGALKFADAVSLQSLLCDQRRAPKTFELGDFKTIENYGYHLDATKFAAMLTRRGVEHLGVTHIKDHVDNVEKSANGDIKTLITRENGEIHGDLFIDCSGQSARLISEELKVPFISQKNILFNDRAIATQIAYQSCNDPIESVTVSTAQSAGWIWDIGLSSRRGIGYVYSSKHTSDNDALTCLKDYLKSSSTNVDDITFKHLEFSPGHREVFWKNNCVAIGMSAGFIEPLEASALVLVELAAKTVALQMPAHREAMESVARQFNDNMHFRWRRIIDFLKLHYVLSDRKDSQFWTDHRQPETIPTTLQEHLKLWRHQEPSNNGFFSPYDLFPAASYQYVLYGMGFQTNRNDLNNVPEYRQNQKNAIDLVTKRRENLPNKLPTNRELLQQILANPTTEQPADEKVIVLNAGTKNVDSIQYILPSFIIEISKKRPIFFIKKSEQFVPVCLNYLLTESSESKKLNNKLTHEINAGFKLNGNIDWSLIFEPVKLDITFENGIELNINELFVVVQSQWKELSSTFKLPQGIIDLINASTQSLQYVPHLIDYENRSRY